MPADDAQQPADGREVRSTSGAATEQIAPTEREPTAEPRIGIVGGGVAGRATLQFLRSVGLHNVTLHEQAPAMAGVGAGIQISPNMARLLRHLGLGGRLDDVGVRLHAGWEKRRWRDGRLLSSQQLGEACERMYGAPYYVAHRADLLKLLGADQPDPMVHLGARCVRAEQSAAEVRLTFDDGSAVDVDAAIGADGVHSVVQLAATTPAVPRFSHLVAYRCLIPADRAPEFARRPVSTSWVGPGRHLVHYPVSRGRDINVAAAVPAQQHHPAESWSMPGSVADFVEEFAGWDDRVTALISAASSTGRYALYDRDPLDRWVNGRIGLVGDAAHPMLPAMAQGAAQAVEDAAVLARCLRTATRQTVGAALLEYQALRLSRATSIQQLSRRRPEEDHLPDGERQRLRDEDLARRDQLSEYGWIWGGGPAA